MPLFFFSDAVKDDEIENWAAKKIQYSFKQYQKTKAAAASATASTEDDDSEAKGTAAAATSTAPKAARSPLAASS